MWDMRRAAVLSSALMLTSLSGAAQAQDLGEALDYIRKNHDSRTVRGYEKQLKEEDTSALAMINSRDVDGHRPLDSYTCDQAPIDGYATIRTSGQQRWAQRACYEHIWKREKLPGFVTLGKVRLSKKQVAPWVRAASAATDVPETLIDTIMRYLSGYRPGVVSERGHIGIMQLKPELLAQMGIAHGNLLDPKENIRAGAHYIRRLTFRHKSVKMAMAAYRDGSQVLEMNNGQIPNDPRYLWFVREVTRIYFASIREFPKDLGADNMAFIWTWME